MGTTDVSRLVSPEEFAAAITARWRSLGNTSSPKLHQLWASMAATFNCAVADSHTTASKWRVLQPPTGTGKTQGLCVYAALTIAKNRSTPVPLGILVVTRTIAQADEIVATVKELVADPADAERARARHSEAKLSSSEMRAADVLVITHEAYTRALEGLQDQHGRWGDYTTWDHGPRRLTIIDEALSGVVEENRVTAGGIRNVLRYIDPPLRRQFKPQVETLDRVCAVLDGLAAMSPDETGSSPARIVWRGPQDRRLRFPQDCQMGPLREAMAGIRYDLMALHKDSPYDRLRISARVDRTLKDCEAIMARWAYYYRKGNDDTFNSSQLLIPPGLPGPVVLDATTSQNFLWRLLGSRAEIAEVPAGTAQRGWRRQSPRTSAPLKPGGGPCCHRSQGSRRGLPLRPRPRWRGQWQPRRRPVRVHPQRSSRKLRRPAPRGPRPPCSSGDADPGEWPRTDVRDARSRDWCALSRSQGRASAGRTSPHSPEASHGRL